MNTLYHEALLKYHVMEERDIPHPGFPPYYPETFFQTIKNVKAQGTLNISRMSSKEWYRVLLEDNLTMELDGQGQRHYKKCRAEVKHPENDWTNSWRLARLSGLESDQITFLWRLLHNILPTHSRLNRMQPDHDPACRSCAYPTEDLLHLFNCPATAEACLALQRCLSLYQPNISPQQTLLLDLVVDPSVEFPLVWLISHVHLDGEDQQEKLPDV